MRGWWLAPVVMTMAISACRSTPAPSPVETTTPTRTTPPAEQPRGRMVVTDTQVEILDPIRFLTGSAALDPRSTPILDAVASTLRGNPSIKLVAVHAYGTDALRQFRGQVGAERAQVVVDQLVLRGVERSRLVAQGDTAPPPGTGIVVAFEILARGK